MNFVLFYHSLLSDWNHGNAHFLRGIASELMARGHRVTVYEPEDGWSLSNLRQDAGDEAVDGFYSAYPRLRSHFYRPDDLDLGAALAHADVVIVHEWNDPGFISRIGRHRARGGGYRLLFHDTHHRAVTDPEALGACDLRHYDGVLAFGGVLRDLYREKDWAARAWIWHEAADVRVFRPLQGRAREGDLVWIGNWGDDERSRELDEFLMEPVRRLALKARVHGVRYPALARAALAAAGIGYGGWIANYRVPAAFARFRVTVHIPRRAYREALPGIPTIRPFEALACGIPLVSAPWEDSEELFRAGRDYLIARNGQEMREHLAALLHDPAFARQMAKDGLETVRSRHTCAHRVDELLAICAELGAAASDTPPAFKRRSA